MRLSVTQPIHQLNVFVQSMKNKDEKNTTQNNSSSEEANYQEQQITALSIEFNVSKRSLAIYGPTTAKNFILAGQEAFSSTVAEYSGSLIERIDNVAIASYTDPNEAIKSAIRTFTVLNRRNSEIPEEQRVNFIISINRGEGIIENGKMHGSVVDRLIKMAHMTGRANNIYVSEDFTEAVKELEGIGYRSVGIASDGISRKFNVYEVFWKDTINIKPHESILTNQFNNRYALIDGINKPCFYCGSKKHLLTQCPSKHLPEITHSFDKLAYFSVKEINTLFSESIAIGINEVRHKWENSENIPDTFFNAYYAFYDIKRVFQLRFFRVIMGYRGNDWHKVMTMNMESSGDALWIALDHIRTGNLTQAESILQDMNETKPDQFNVNMALGYLNIEKGYHIHALNSFEKAYTNADTKPKKILALLLASRMHDFFFNNVKAAREQISLIRRIEHNCPEAVYQDIVLKMKYEKDAKIISELIRLVKRNHEYYLIALIDPELAIFQTEINKELNALLKQVKDSAHFAFEEAENDLNQLESWLGKNDENMHDLRESFSTTRELFASDCYFGYLDVACKLPSISASCNRLVMESREKIDFLIDGLRQQIHELTDYCKKNRKTEFVNVLGGLKEKVTGYQNKADSPLPYKETMIDLEKLSDQVKIIQNAVDKFKKRKTITSSALKSLMKVSLVFIALASVGLIVMFILNIAG